MKKIIINIGRQFGSGGRAVARELGRRLDIPVYDHELLSEAAQDSGFSRDLFKQKDEKHKGFSMRTALMSSWNDEATNYLNEGRMFQLQSETIRNIAEKGSAIIVGRCADYILRDMDCIFNVFLTCPHEDRVKRVCERMNLDEKTAEEIIAKKDKGRESYYNYYTFGNWGVAKTYDLCMDTSILGIEGTADFIIEFARRAGMLEEK